MAEAKQPLRKYCMVPECKNNSWGTPDKVFFRIPTDKTLGKQWCETMKRGNLSTLSRLYCCEDHFDVKEDTLNYIQYNLMKQEGHKCILRLKKGVVPHKFLCQNPDVSPPIVRMGRANRKQLALLKQALAECSQRSDKEIDSQKIISTNQDTAISLNNEINLSQNKEETIINIQTTAMKEDKEMKPCLQIEFTPEPSTSLGPKGTNLELSSITEKIDAQITLKKSTDVTSDDVKTRIRELDKFKRRLIRAVARLTLVEKKPQDQIWLELKKETNCDCKLLWMRMRALTIKKLKRLIAANDSNFYITKIAQLSVTDWLLFDLVLVHEDVDVIGLDLPREGDKDLKVLEDLFDLVLKYQVELLGGDSLTIAWYELAKEYNHGGRTCSPMLLQRRWYQMKMQTRHKFYNFWFEYRGSEKNIPQASKYKPTALEMEIVKVFMNIVTYPFKSWEQLIDERRVSTPSDFERLQLARRKKASSENEPDIELVEPHVETIDLGVESDDSKDGVDSIDGNENSNKDFASIEPIKNKKESTATVIKTESIYDICDEDEVNALESMHIPLECDMNKNVESLGIKEIDKSHHVINTSSEENECMGDNKDDEENCVEDSGDDFVKDDDYNERIDVDTQVVEQNDIEVVMPKITHVTSAALKSEIVDTDEIPHEINSLVEKVSNEFTQNNSCIKPKKEKTEFIENDIPEATLSHKEDVDRKPEIKTDFVNEEFSNNLHLIDGIELEDDGIEYIDEEEEMQKECTVQVKTEVCEADKEEDDDTPKIDLKLLLTPVVYTKKLDHMDVFRFLDYILVKDRRVIENAIVESKPFDKKSVKMEEISKEFGTALEHDEKIGKDSHCSSDDEKEFIKTTSWLLRKPRVATYNPIQLCKNPDFNTRLKKITVGFLSSQRNRQLLKQCKPLTIDVHKSFETKLVDNCLYLKKAFFSEAKKSETMKVVEETVSPSELPGQTLYVEVPAVISSTITSPTSIVSIASNAQCAPEVCSVERNKVINLPDLDQIRRQNEKLLIAEVTPLQASNIISKPPVSIVQTVEMEQTYENSTVQQNETDRSSSELNLKRINTADNTIINKNTNSIPYDMNKLYYDQMSNVSKNLAKRSKALPKPSKVRKVAVTWNSKKLRYSDIHIPDDRLLAADTVERIINLCQGTHLPMLKKKQKAANKKKRKANAESQANAKEDLQETPKEPPQQQETIQNEIVDEVENKSCSEIIDAVNNIDHKLQVMKNNAKRRRIRRQLNKIYCCWAREKLELLNNKITRVKSRHLCPQKKCFCCCNIEYITVLRQKRNDKVDKLVSYLNLVSDDDSDHTGDNINESEKPLQSLNDKKLHPSKVTIGINTDFDKDFEKMYAENLSRINSNHTYTSRNQPFIPCVTSKGPNETYNNATQTICYRPITPELKEKVICPAPDVTDYKKNTDPLNYVPKQLHPIETNIEQLNSIQPKCTTKISIYESNAPKTYMERENLNTKSLLLPNPNITDKSLTTKCTSSSKVLVMKNKNINEINNHSYQKPVFLGKNKILLCSLTPLSKASVIDVTYLANNIRAQDNITSLISQPPLLPEGVHIVLLPNHELVLSINPGIELDHNQLSFMPPILNSVQQQLRAAGIMCKLSSTDCQIPETSDVIQLSDDECEKSKTIKSNDGSSLENNMNEQIEINRPVTDLEDGIACRSINRVDEADACSNNDGNINNPSIEQIDDNDMHSNSSKVNEDTESVLNITNNENLKDNVANSKHNLSPTPNNDALQVSVSHVDEDERISIDATKKNDLQNTVSDGSEAKEKLSVTSDKSHCLPESGILKNSKKTILSDLMEMSGISLDDTAVTDIVSSTTQETTSQVTVQPTLQAMSQPTLQLQLQGLNAISNHLPSHLKESNNPIFANPFVQAALLKCPDLNIVYNFEDLKYGYENKGHFYKMDIETGVIVPINVCIRKQLLSVKSNTKIMPKSVIDLTEDDVEDNQISIAKPDSEENSIQYDISQTFSFVKPVKLFKAVHPSILKHNLKSLMKAQSNVANLNNVKVKKVIKIIKQKRKQTFKEKDEYIKKSKITKCVENERSDSSSESDDEPLALKAKRIRRNPENTLDNIEHYNIDMEDNKEINLTPINPNELSTSDQHDCEETSEQPLIIQYNNEDSSEEDCILGV